MELDLRDYLKIIRKRIIWLIALVVIACTATAVVSYLVLEPVYEAKTKLIVNKPNQPAVMDQVNINDINANIRLIDTYKEIIKTSSIMDKVAAENPEFNMNADQLINKVRVSSVNNTQVMTLIVADRSYEQAVAIVNAVSKVFQREIPTIMSVDNVSILSEAKITPVPEPVKPQPELNIAISFVVALMIGLGIIFLLEYLDDTIKTEADVREILELPTLGMITKVSEQEKQETLSKAKTMSEEASRRVTFDQ